MKRIQIHVNIVFLLIISWSVSSCASLRAYLHYEEESVEAILLDFDRIKTGNGYSRVEKGIYIINNQRDFESIWNMAHAGQIPHVEFEYELVIAVFRGSCASLSYSVYIDRIELTDRTILVYVKYQNPGRYCIQRWAISHPNTFIKMQRTDKYIDFIEEIVINECNPN